MQENLAELLEVARTVARKGGRQTLEYFRKSLKIEHKEDDSPVTLADRMAEEVMRTEIYEHYPEHGILGEELGHSQEEHSVQWILDPIDGTISYIHGIPLYTTLVGITIDNKPAAGVIYAPALDEMCDGAIGLGAYFNGSPCKAKTTSKLEEATLITTDLAHIKAHGHEEAFHRLHDRCRYYRTWGDAYGHMMVATGRVDIMVDPVLNIWDSAALLPVVTESGAMFTGLNGLQRIDAGNALSATSALHPEILEFFNT